MSNNHQAVPGDVCIFVRDQMAEGRNIGKRCVVLEQCCLDDCWTVEALEPLHAREMGTNEISRCPAGASVCCRKTDVRPLRDPDKSATPDPVTKPVEDMQ